MSRLSGLSGWIVASAAVCALFAGAAIGGPTTPAAVNGCVYNATPPTLSDGQVTVVQCDSSANIRTTASIPGTVTVRGGVTPADATALGTTSVGAFSYNGVYNGTTEDLWRGAANGLNSTGTGLATSQLVGQCDDTSPVAITENSFGNARVNCADHALLIGGAIAEDAAAGTTYPVPVGGIYRATLPTYTDLDRTQWLTDPRGNLKVVNAVYPFTGGDGLTNNVSYFGSPTTTSSVSGLLGILQHNFNGSTWDRQFVCSSFAAVSVTAGNTTQIVALSASTVIRVCNFYGSISADGSFAMVSGTGSNCGTPANSTGDILAKTNTPINLGNGAAAIYRGTAGGEFCVKATTGNVVGYITYAQY